MKRFIQPDDYRAEIEKMYQSGEIQHKEYLVLSLQCELLSELRRVPSEDGEKRSWVDRLTHR